MPWYQAGLDNLKSFKNGLIDREIDKILAYANSHPNFMTAEQKDELQKIRQEVNLPPSKHGWALDDWDDNSEVMA